MNIRFSGRRGPASWQRVEQLIEVRVRALLDSVRGVDEVRVRLVPGVAGLLQGRAVIRARGGSLVVVAAEAASARDMSDRLVGPLRRALTRLRARRLASRRARRSSSRLSDL